MAEELTQEMTDAMVALAEPFDRLADQFRSLNSLAEQIRKAEVPVLTLGVLDNNAKELSAAIEALRRFVKDQQRKGEEIGQQD